MFFKVSKFLALQDKWIAAFSVSSLNLEMTTGDKSKLFILSILVLLLSSYSTELHAPRGYCTKVKS